MEKKNEIKKNEIKKNEIKKNEISEPLSGEVEVINDEEMPVFVGEALGSLYIRQDVPAFADLKFPVGSLFLTEDSEQNWPGETGVCFIPLGHMITKEFYQGSTRIHMGIGGKCDFNTEICITCRDHPPICARCCHNSSNPFSKECYNVHQFLALFLGAEAKDLTKISTPLLLRIPFKRMTLPGFNQIESIQLGLRMKGVPQFSAVLRYRTFYKRTSKGMSAYVPRISVERDLTKAEITTLINLRQIFRASLGKSRDIIPQTSPSTVDIPSSMGDVTMDAEVEGKVVDPLQILDEI